MDAERFDLLTKSLSSGFSRRKVLRSLVATLGSVALGADGTGAKPENGGPKKCYGGGSHCTNAKQCCSGVCTNRQCAPETPPDPCAGMSCDDGNPCTNDSCSGGVCSNVPVAAGTTCPGGFCNSTGTCISGVCMPLATRSCYSGPPGTQGVGECRAGTKTCDETGQWGPCVGEVTPVPEICGDGLDNDCDGIADDGCPALCVTPADCPGTDTECQTRTCDDAGACGMQFAAAGTALANQVAGDCHQLQCDGNGGVVSVVDNSDVPDDGDDCTTGICTNGVPSQTPDPAGTPCTGGFCDGVGSCQAGECFTGQTRPCYTGPVGTEGVGTCHGGTQTCNNGPSWGPCEDEVTPEPEICGDGIDNDCDGVVDEGCSTTTTTSPPCVSTGQCCCTSSGFGNCCSANDFCNLGQVCQPCLFPPGCAQSCDFDSDCPNQPCQICQNSRCVDVFCSAVDLCHRGVCVPGQGCQQIPWPSGTPCGLCQFCDGAGQCVFAPSGSACGDCQACDANGNCIAEPAGTPCGICRECSASGGCTFALPGTPCGTCRECAFDFGAVGCFPAPAGRFCGACHVCDGSSECIAEPAGTSCGICKECNADAECVPFPDGADDPARFCTSGVICCAGACVNCCGSDNSNCAVFGYDLECAVCNLGQCQTDPLDFGPCTDAFSGEEGFCSEGFCFPCKQNTVSCTHPNECCSDVCDAATGRCASS